MLIVMKNFFNNAAYDTGADVDQPVFDAVQTPPGADENPAEKKGFNGLPYWKRVAIVWIPFALMLLFAKMGYGIAELGVFAMLPMVLGVLFGIEFKVTKPSQTDIDNDYYYHYASFAPANRHKN